MPKCARVWSASQRIFQMASFFAPPGGEFSQVCELGSVRALALRWPRARPTPSFAPLGGFAMWRMATRAGRPGEMRARAQLHRSGGRPVCVGSTALAALLRIRKPGHDIVEAHRARKARGNQSTPAARTHGSSHRRLGPPPSSPTQSPEVPSRKIAQASHIGGGSPLATAPTAHAAATMTIGAPTRRELGRGNQRAKFGECHSSQRSPAGALRAS